MKKLLGIKCGKRENLIAQDLEPSLEEKPPQLLIITPDVATPAKSNVLLIELNQIENLIERYGSIKFSNQHNRILPTEKKKEVIEPNRTLIGNCIYHVILGSRRANAHPCTAFSHAISVKAFRWRTRSDHVTRNALAARNNAAYGQSKGRQSFRTLPRYH